MPNPADRQARIDQLRETIRQRQESKKGLGRFASALTQPVVNVPELPGGKVGKFIGEAVEQSTTPIGLASMFLSPMVRGGRGLAGLAKMGAGEVAVNAAGLGAAKVADAVVPDDALGGYADPVAQITAGLLAGAKTGIALGGKSIRYSRLAELQEADKLVTAADFTGPDKLAYLVRNADTVLDDVGVQRTAQRGARIGEYEGIRKEAVARGAGEEEAHNRALSAMKGELATRRFVDPGKYLEPAEVDSIMKTIDASQLRPYEQLATRSALMNIVKNGEMPTNYEIDLLKRVYGDDFVASLEAHRTKGEQWRQYFWQAVNLPRALTASFDMSAPLRQGALLAGRPKEFFGALKPMFKAWGDEKFAEQTLEDIATGPRAELMRASGLEITGINALDITHREEQFLSQISNGLSHSLMGRGIAASERAYAVFMNKLRADHFGAVVNDWEKAGKVVTGKDYKDLATFINYATGRGKLPGSLERAAPSLNAFFFAPRLVYSRFAAPAQLFTATPEVRREIARNLGAFVGTGVAVLGGLKASGWLDVEMDPRSSDFGKGKIVGTNTRVDFWAGYQPVARYAAQFITGQQKTGTGKIVDANRADTFGRFFRSKEAPTVGFAHSVLSGTTFTGEQVRGDISSVERTMAATLLPLFFQDMSDGIKDAGGLGAVLTVPAFFGWGVQTFSTLSQEQDAAAQRLFNKEYDDLGWSQKQIVNADERVVAKDAEILDTKGAGDWKVKTDKIETSRLRSESAMMAALAQGMDPKKFADGLERINRNASVAKDATASALGIDISPPGSKLQATLAGYYDLFKRADVGAAQGVETGNIDWEVFDQLEKQYMDRLTPDEKAFVEDRKVTPHPDTQWFYDAKKRIANSGYYDTVDTAYKRNLGAVRSVAPNAQNLGDVIELRNLALANGNTLTTKRLDAVLNRINTEAGKAKEALRKRNPQLDADLFSTGRTTKLVNPGNLRLATRQGVGLPKE